MRKSISLFLMIYSCFLYSENTKVVAKAFDIVITPDKQEITLDASNSLLSSPGNFIEQTSWDINNDGQYEIVGPGAQTTVKTKFLRLQPGKIYLVNFKIKENTQQTAIGKLNVYVLTTAATISGIVRDALTNKAISHAQIEIIAWYKTNHPVPLSPVANNENGTFKIDSLPGTHIYLKVTANKYLSTSQVVYFTPGESKRIHPTLLLPLAAKDLKASIRGVIDDAVSSTAVENIQIKCYRGMCFPDVEFKQIKETFSTSSTLKINGEDVTQSTYQIKDLDAGVYTLIAKDLGSGNYLANWRYVIIHPQKEKIWRNIALVPLQNEEAKCRIVVEWGKSPEDLDAHIIGPTTNKEKYHVYWNQQVAPDKSYQLDRDSRKSYGPETISINQLLPGEYTYLVQNYSEREQKDTNGLTSSGALVRVFYKDHNPIVYYPKPYFKGCVWSVFKILVSQSKQVKFVFQDEYYDQESSRGIIER